MTSTAGSDTSGRQRGGDGPGDLGLALVTGATGYIGARLVPALLDSGWRVRVLSRDPRKLTGRPWVDEVDVVAGDAVDPETLAEALDGVEVAYYLLHSMDALGDFGRRDRELVTAFCAAAESARVKRIVYLGGLHPADEELSDHLASRAEVGEVLLASSVPATVLQAAVILGAGSTSFEMLRHLTDRLPAMVAPRWLSNRIQPIAVRDVLHYLVAAAGMPPEVNRTFDIGGPDVVTYRELMRRYAVAAGLRPRLVVVVPVLTPKLASHWVGLVTPVPKAIAKPLVASLLHEVVCSEHDIVELVGEPPGGLLDVDEAMDLALRRADDFPAAGRLSGDGHGPGSTEPSDAVDGDPDWVGGTVLTDERSSHVDATPDQVWSVIEHVGDDGGPRLPTPVREIQGVLDRLGRGLGRSPGRSDPSGVPGGTGAWWVEQVEPGRGLLLRTESGLPGVAWLELTVRPGAGATGTTLGQRLVFRPRGLIGLAFWRASLPARLLAVSRLHRDLVAMAQAAGDGVAGDGEPGARS